MPNPTGVNQYNKKDYPSDEDLLAAFKQYAAEKNGAGLNTAEQLARLEKDFGLPIGRSKLFELRKRVGAPSVRKNPTPDQDRTQALINAKENDLAGRWGVEQTRQRMANGGVLITRDELRSKLHDHFDHEFDKRMIGSKDRIERVPLNCLGPWHQLHCDGHEKLNSQALAMGSVSLPIYAFKDQFSTFVPLMDLVPDVRNQQTICHLFLDLVEKYGCVPLQLVMDKGTEVGDMIRAQIRLRLEAAPDYTEQEWPTTVQVQSKHNTPIEGFWRWKRNGEGHSIKQAIVIGRENGLFNPNNPLHLSLFNWLWPPLVRERLEEFRTYWNNHKLSKQKKKLLPSGTSPRQMWEVPDSVRADARNCSVRVGLEANRQLRDGIGGMAARAEAYAFVDPEFQSVADNALGVLGYPEITLSNAWDIFTSVFRILSSSESP
ncbi:hypothetical protein HGRIS_007210 [Hohenbuehelia grisea]|uniref:Integrase core domain-containing protein n=1 Tax=Hohenbuehelia grisea TaxID=104357 RepID=A0ABR3JD26_9AGAR